MRISVIIPVYNAERYLPTCIESLLVQTMPDFELLLINDGSTDNSKAVCDRYAAQDRRIRVFDSPNRGVSAARNLGLDQARGEFVVFVDSDDWVVPEHLQQFTESGIGEDGIAFTNLFEERPGRRKTPEASCPRKAGARKAVPGSRRMPTDLKSCVVTEKQAARSRNGPPRHLIRTCRPKASGPENIRFFRT